MLPETALIAGLPKAKDGKAPPLEPGKRRDELASEIYEFVIDRLRGYYVDAGIAAERFEAVRALAPSDLSDFDARLRAVSAFAGLPEAQALAAANKRIGNILRQAGPDDAASAAIDAAAITPGAESDLYNALVAEKLAAAPLIASRNYVDLLKQLARLRAPVDAFFDGVMVMADDPAVRANRLALLAQLRALFLHVADISQLQTA